MSQSGGNQKPAVLIADNDRQARAELGQKLQMMGYPVTVCAHLKEMFASLKPLKEALLFIDMHIDNMDCLELLPKIISRAEQVGRQYIILAMSDFGGATIALSVTKAGAFRYLKKPILDTILQSALNEAEEELRHGGSKGKEIERFVKQAEPEPAPEPEVPIEPPEVKKKATPIVNEPDEIKVITIKRGGKDSADEILGGRKHSMERMTVLRIAPEEPGVLTLFDTNDEPLYIEWAGNLSQRLCYYVDLHPASSEIARTARYFEIVATMDRGEEAKIFDRIVNKIGKFPQLMKESPEGSRHFSCPSKADSNIDEARVTGYNKSIDTELIERIKKLQKENPTDPAVQDWLAFTLYSNNLLVEAVDWYTKLITNGSRKEEHFFYCANAFYKKGDVDRAIKMWRVAMSLNPNSTISRKSAKRLDAAMSGEDPGLTTY